MKNIAGAIIVIGLIGFSVWGEIHGIIEGGWGVLAFLVLLTWGWKD